MKSIKLFIVLVALSMPFGSFSQEYFASANHSVVETETPYSITKISTQDQEYNLVNNLNRFLVDHIEYPYEAREHGEEGTIRAVVLLSPDHSSATLKIAKGSPHNLKRALITAFEKIEIRRFVTDNYEGRGAIPIKINFELD